MGQRRCLQLPPDDRAGRAILVLRHELTRLERVRTPQKGKRAILGAPHATPAPDLMMIVAKQMEHAVNHQQRQLVCHRMTKLRSLCDAAVHRDGDVAQIKLLWVLTGISTDHPPVTQHPTIEGEHVGRRVNAAKLLVQRLQLRIVGQSHREFNHRRQVMRLGQSCQGSPTHPLTLVRHMTTGRPNMHMNLGVRRRAAALLTMSGTHGVASSC
jgi:hypothetical protein